MHSCDPNDLNDEDYRKYRDECTRQDLEEEEEAEKNKYEDGPSVMSVEYLFGD